MQAELAVILGNQTTESTRIDDESILIRRISFTSTLSSSHTLLRRQFPLAHAYATTFNSCQGLTLDIVGVDLTRPVFSHGQLYIALSRIRHSSHVKIRLQPEKNTTVNVTYNENLVWRQFIAGGLTEILVAAGA